MANAKHEVKDAFEKIVDGARHVDGIGTPIAKPKTTIKRHGSETRGMDTPGEKPDMPKKPRTHKPNDGGGGTKKNPDGTDKRKGVDRGDGRDDYGHFVSSDNRPWVDKEQIGLDRYARRERVDVVRTQVVVDYDGSPQNGRRYDGLVRNSDGTYTGVEIKSGDAIDRYRQDGNTQNIFDTAVNAGEPARGVLNGVEIFITRVVVRIER